MNSEFSHFTHDEQWKAENDFLKMKMMLEHGAEFGSVGNSEIPPGIENQFLKSVMEFEKQFENTTYIKVFDKLKRPTHFKPVTEIKDADISSAWSELSDYLSQYGVSLDACSPNISPRELYRFTIEELFEEEVEDISLPGMTQCFIYDIFHPDTVYENTRLAKEECIEYILDKIPMQGTYNFKKENLQLNNYPLLSIDEFTKIVNRFKDAYDNLEIDQIQESVCIVQEKESWVTGVYSITATSGKEVYPLSGKWKVVYEKDDHLEYWYINTVIIEGINF
jgi:hypothetical protein